MVTKGTQVLQVNENGDQSMVKISEESTQNFILSVEYMLIVIFQIEVQICYVRKLKIMFHMCLSRCCVSMQASYQTVLSISFHFISTEITNLQYLNTIICNHTLFLMVCLLNVILIGSLSGYLNIVTFFCNHEMDINL